MSWHYYTKMKRKGYKLGQLTGKTLRRKPLRAKNQLPNYSHSKIRSENLMDNYDDYLCFLSDCDMIACYEPSFYLTYESGRTFLFYYDEF
jgi:hypothetical protein